MEKAHSSSQVGRRVMSLTHQEDELGICNEFIIIITCTYFTCAFYDPPSKYADAWWESSSCAASSSNQHIMPPPVESWKWKKCCTRIAVGNETDLLKC